jgi:hypothetical protein
MEMQHSTPKPDFSKKKKKKLGNVKIKLGNWLLKIKNVVKKFPNLEIQMVAKQNRMKNR